MLNGWAKNLFVIILYWERDWYKDLARIDNVIRREVQNNLKGRCGEDDWWMDEGL
jgi:hypothetical protein